MGQYRFSMYAKWQLGLLISIETTAIIINIPFVEINIATTQYAEGIRIFNWYNN